MRQRPSRGWYVVALILVAMPVSYAGVTLGMQLRSTMAAFSTLPAADITPIQLEAGETRTLFYKFANGQTAAPQECKFYPLDGQESIHFASIDTPFTLTVSDGMWQSEFRLVADRTARVNIRCPDDRWAIGPDVGANGLGIFSTYATWLARSAAVVLLGSIACGVMVLVVALRRRPATS